MNSHNQINSLAPVVVFVYNRIEKLKRCIDSLRQNSLAPLTELYVISDGARPGDEEIVRKVRQYVDGVTGFRSVNKVFHSENMGATASMRRGRDEAFSLSAKIIAMEDDNEVAPNFLDFMNQALDFYELDDRVFSVGGYKAPFALPRGYSNDYWFGPWFNPWTYGVWKNKFHAWDVNTGYKETLKQARNRQMIRKMGRFMLDSALLDSYEIARANDARVCMHMFERGMVSVFPSVSLANNIGNDGLGLHAKATKRFDVAVDKGEKRKFGFEQFDVLDKQVVQSYRRFMDKGYFGTMLRDVGLARLKYRLRKRFGR